MITDWDETKAVHAHLFSTALMSQINALQHETLEFSRSITHLPDAHSAFSFNRH